jgi:hypothetical protein
VLFIQHKPSPDEIIGAAQAWPSSPDPGIRTSRIVLPIPAGAGSLFAVGPAFRFSGVPQSRWLPFTGVPVWRSLILQHDGQVVRVLSLWLARGRAWPGFGRVLFLVTLLLEVLQIYLPGRARNTDPVLKRPAVLLWLLSRREQASPATHPRGL